MKRIGLTMSDKLQFVAAAEQKPLPNQRQTEVCRTSLLTATLGLGYLGDDFAKLAKACGFICCQQRTFRIQDPVVFLLQFLHLRCAAPKQLAQQTPGSITIDRFPDRFR